MSTMRPILEDGTQLLSDGRRVIIFRNQARWDYHAWKVDAKSKRQALIDHLTAMQRFFERHPGSFTPYQGRELIWREYEPQAWVSDSSGAAGMTRPSCEWISELVLDDEAAA